jgi:hypothetical protein
MTFVLAHVTPTELGTGVGLFAAGLAAGIVLGGWLLRLWRHR